MFSSISSNVTSWLGGTAPDDGPEDDTTNAQSSSPVKEGEKKTPTQSQPTATSDQQETDKETVKTPEDGSKEEMPAKTEADLQHQLDEVGAKAVKSAKEWGTWLYGVGKTATTEIVKTAKVVKDTVEEKTILGDFSKEQDKFVTENTEKKKKGEVGVAPWIGYNEEEEMKKQILALSKDQRNFLRSPPSGVQFQFDYGSMYPVALAVLQEDPNLSTMRFQLVPKSVKEEAFWRNYFYRVSLIKQSAQLTAMAQTTGSTGEVDHTKSAEPIREESTEEKVKQQKQRESESEAVDVAGSPPENEFISDAFQESHYDEEALKKEMQQLGVQDDKQGDDDDAGEYLLNVVQKTERDTAAGEDSDVPEWERELAAELQEYEVVADGLDGEGDADLEQEILQQLEQDK